MKMIREKGNYTISAVNMAMIPAAVVVLLIGSTAFGGRLLIPICAVFCILMLAYLIIWIATSIIPMEVRFDKEWLMTKQMMFTKDVRMEDISRVQYYIRKESSEGNTYYYLILEIDYKGGKMKLQEPISKNEIEYCKQCNAFKELFILYRFFEEEYPEKAKGYWRYCGF